MQHMYFCTHVFGRHHLPTWTLLWMLNKFVSFHPSNWDQLSFYSRGYMYTPVISCPRHPLAAPPQRKAGWTYRSTGSPSRPWWHSVALRPATAAASWCRSPTAAPASSPSPAWSHCHSQSSSLMSPPANGPHHTELHSGHDAWGHDGGRGERKWWECQMYTNVWSHDSRQWWAIMNHISFIQTGDKLKPLAHPPLTFFFLSLTKWRSYILH